MVDDRDTDGTLDGVLFSHRRPKACGVRRRATDGRRGRVGNEEVDSFFENNSPKCEPSRMSHLRPL